MRKKRAASHLLLPHGVRALVPVLAAHGGAGRSTMAGLLAQVLAPTTRTVVVDPAPRASSPWTAWLGVDEAPPGHTGLPSLVPSAGGTLDQAHCARSVVARPVPLGRRDKKDLLDIGPSGLEGPGYDVLADTRPVTAPPAAVPDDPGWYAALVDAGGWFAGIVDTDLALPAAHIRARNERRASALDLWWRRTDAVPVLLASSGGDGLAALLRLLDLLDRDGFGADRAVVGVVDVGGPNPPRRVRRQVAALGGRSALLVRVPYDEAIRAYGLARLEDVSDGVLEAARTIARHVARTIRPFVPTESADERPATSPQGGTSGPEASTGGWTPTRHRVAETPYEPPDQDEPHDQEREARTADTRSHDRPEAG